MDRIKIGQIGVGHAHAGGKMEVYRTAADFEVVGVVEPDPALRAQAQRSKVYDGLRWMTRDELLSTPGLKAVAVETHVRDLLANAEACVKAGLHIHLDKPAGTDLAHFRRILAIADQKHLEVQMGYMYRYNPAVLMLHQFLAEGWLGDVFEIHAVMSKVIEPSTRRGLAEFPGGIMFELGCHLVDLVVKILGKPNQVTAFKQHASDQTDSLVDNMLAVFTYPKSLASVKSSALEVEGFSRRHLVVCGTEGTFHIQPLDAPSVRFALSRRAGTHAPGVHEKKFGDYDRYVGDAADFARIIRGEKDTSYPSPHNLAVQETLLQACGLPN